jgi:EAL domain-containing protein (putative c-di-GMP-specific phosphodiesterase class I)
VEDTPWATVGAIFIGGTTEWKLGPQARAIILEAKRRGLWVHVGRVNSKQRIEQIYAMGVDSFDGSGWSRWPDTRIPKGLQWIDDAAIQTISQGKFF